MDYNFNIVLEIIMIKLLDLVGGDDRLGFPCSGFLIVVNDSLSQPLKLVLQLSITFDDAELFKLVVSPNPFQTKPLRFRQVNRFIGF